MEDFIFFYWKIYGKFTVKLREVYQEIHGSLLGNPRIKSFSW